MICPKCKVDKTKFILSCRSCLIKIVEKGGEDCETLDEATQELPTSSPSNTIKKYDVYKGFNQRIKEAEK